MKLRRLGQSLTFRLALLYMLLFSFSTAVLLAVAFDVADVPESLPHPARDTANVNSSAPADLLSMTFSRRDPLRV